jgi:hypothetical protein
MIKEERKWMCYHYFHRNPRFGWKATFLFSPVRKDIPGMKRLPCNTIVTDIRECDFLNTWSSSTRTKVRKAENEPLELHRGVDLLPRILDLFRQTAGLKKLRGHFPEDFDTRPWIICSAIYSGDKMLAGHVWVIDEEERRALLFVNASAHHDASVDPSLVSRAHYYLLWQDGLHLRNNGIDCLDLHGYAPETKDPGLAGVYRWKEGTHGEAQELFHYYPLWFYLLRKWRQSFSR